MSSVEKYIYKAEGREQPLYYLEGGAGWPVLLLHGWGCSSETMLPVFQHLAANFHVYCFDSGAAGGLGYDGLCGAFGGIYPKKMQPAAGFAGSFLWRPIKPAAGGGGGSAQDDFNRLRRA